KLFELVRLDAVIPRAGLAPFAFPDAGVGDDRIRVHHVDADTDRPALFRQTAGKVDLTRLGGAVGRTVLSGHQPVLGADEDDTAAPTLLLQHAECLTAHEEVASGEDRLQLLPLRQ